MTAHTLDDLAHLARSTPARKGFAKGRTVIRFDKRDLRRLDGLRAKLGWPSRAAIVRVFVHWGLDMVDAAPASKEGGAP